MWEISKLLYAIGLPCIAGYQILSFITKRRQASFFLTIAISFGLGLGVLTQCMLIMGALRFEYSTLNISIMLFLIYSLFTILITVKKNSLQNNTFLIHQKPYPQPEFKAFSWTIISFFIISYYLISSFWTSLNLPVYTWDSFATCIYTAKIIYFSRSLESFPYFAHASYPLHIQMITAWISFNLGQWDDQIFKIIFPLTFTAFVIIYNAFLVSYTNKKWALLGILMLFSSNLLILHTTIAYRDLTTMFYNCSAIIFLAIWERQDDDAFLILAALFSGFGTFVKQEGTAHLFIHILVVLFILHKYKHGSLKEKIKKALKFLIPSLTIFSLFYCFKLISGVSTTSYLNFDLIHAISLIPLVLNRFFETLFLTANWNILWAFLVISILLNLKKVTTDSTIQVILVSIMLFLGLLISLSILIGKEFIIHPQDISRVILHFFPLCPIAIILLIHPNPKEDPLL